MGALWEGLATLLLEPGPGPGPGPPVPEAVARDSFGAREVQPSKIDVFLMSMSLKPRTIVS